MRHEQPINMRLAGIILVLVLISTTVAVYEAFWPAHSKESIDNKTLVCNFVLVNQEDARSLARALVDDDSPIVPKSWTMREKQSVILQLERLKLNYPQLLEHVSSICSSKSPCIIYRCENFVEDARTVGLTRPSSIGLTDGFFRLSQHEQGMTLIHELIHFVDQGNVISYSSEWLSFCGRARSGVIGGFPNVDVSQDVGEVLAESISYYLCGNWKDESSEIYYKIIVPLVFRPHKKQIEFVKNYRAGMLTKDHFEALAYFHAAINNIPSAPLPYYAIAVIDYDKNNFEAAIDNAKQSEAAFDSLDSLSKKDLVYFRLRILHATALLRLNRTSQAQELANKIRDEHSPNHEVQRLLHILQDVISRLKDRN